MEQKFDAMVICSTLNQMVNYLAIKQHGIDMNCVYNIRIGEYNKDSKGKSIKERKFNYDKWDESLAEALSDNSLYNNYIALDKESISEHKMIIEKLIDESEEKFENKKVLWNITGGQRHIVMAITEYVFENREDDVILYFDGDTEKYCYYSKNKQENKKYIFELKSDYAMSIPIALRLMGFNDKENKKNIKCTSKYYKFLKSKDKDEFIKMHKEEGIKIDDDKLREEYKDISKEYEWYKKFNKIYGNEKNKMLIHILVNSNKDNNEDIEVFDKLEKDIEGKKDEIKEYEKIFNEKGFKILKKSIDDYTNGRVFGYILENMTLYKIIEAIKDNNEDTNLLDEVADIDKNVRIGKEKNEDDKEFENRVVDEFDIVLLTKQGKLTVFECKSGKMTGDNAKSTNYSTYAVSGVYGTPILISPITLIEAKYESKNNEEKEEYKNIKLAINAGWRANLVIWGVNEVSEKIKEVIPVKEREDDKFV